MPTIRDDAAVLSRLDYSETSQIIVLFTREHGKVRAIAKGIQRGTKTRFAAGIDLLDIGHLVASSREERTAHLATVTEWKQTRSFLGLREKLFRIQAAEYVAEVTAHLTEDWDPHAGLFDALLSTLEELSDASEPLGPIVGYQLRLLEAIGLLPRLDACVLCGRPDSLTHFSSFEGGMVCRNCEPGQVEKWAVTPSILETLNILASRGRNLSRPRREPARGDPASRGLQAARISAQAQACGSLAGAFGVLNYHIAHLMNREPRLASKLLPPVQRRPT